MEKPIIRHCRNCEFAKISVFDNVYCTVKYEPCVWQRLEAVLCRFYKKKVE